MPAFNTRFCFANRIYVRKSYCLLPFSNAVALLRALSCRVPPSLLHHHRIFVFGDGIPPRRSQIIWYQDCPSCFHHRLTSKSARLAFSEHHIIVLYYGNDPGGIRSFYDTLKLRSGPDYFDRSLFHLHTYVLCISVQSRTKICGSHSNSDRSAYILATRSQL